MIKINEKGRSKIIAWIHENAKHPNISDANIDAWCQQAEQSYIEPNPRVSIELSDRDSNNGEWLVLCLDKDCYTHE